MPSTRPRCVVTGMKSANAATVVRASLPTARRNFVLFPAMVNGKPRHAWPGYMVDVLMGVAAAMLVSYYWILTLKAPRLTSILDEMIDDNGHPRSPTSTEPGASTNLGDLGESRFSEFFAGRWFVCPIPPAYSIIANL